MRINKHERKATTKQLNDIWKYVVAIFILLIIVFFFGFNVLFLSIDEKHGSGSTKGEPSDTTLVEELRDTFIDRKNNAQQKSATFSEKYAGRKYIHYIRVENGQINWTFSDEVGKISKILTCNPDVDADIIIAEFKGLAYWNIACDLIINMVEEENSFQNDIYESAKDAIAKSVSSFSKATETCPNAYKKAQEIYKNLINAENSGADALWNELATISYSVSEENPIEVCDIDIIIY